MNYNEMSNFSNEELSMFSHLELQLKTLEEISDSLSREEQLIPAEISAKLNSSSNRLIPKYTGKIITLPDAIHVGRVILCSYSQHTGKATELSIFISAFDDLVQFFFQKKE